MVKSDFTASTAKTMGDLDKSLNAMNGVIAGVRKCDDGAAELKISLDGQMYGWRCETYRTYRENIRAIERFIAHMYWDWHKHGIQKLGLDSMQFTDVMAGFQITDGTEPSAMALPRTPWEILGISADAATDEITAAYRGLSKLYHPDNPKTGNAKLFKQIEEAKSAML